MLVLVSYDVATASPDGAKRLRRVAKICQNYGQRVQYSVFECKLAPDQWVECKSQLLNTVDLGIDSLRFYFLGSKWHSKVEHFGAKSVPDFESDSLII